MLNGKVHYFAYDHLLSGAQMREILPKAVALSYGFVTGHRLAFAGHSPKWGGGVATLVQARGGVVFGNLYLIPSDDLEKLDRHHASHRRIGVRVRARSGGSQRVQGHQLIDAVLEAPPSASYLEALGKAYRSLGYELSVPDYQAVKISSPTLGVRAGHDRPHGH